MIVSLTGGTVGNVSGNVIDTSATTGTTTITSNVDLTSTGGRGISATSTTGTININGTGAVSGQSDGIQAQASGAGNINVTSGGAITGGSCHGHRRAIGRRQCARRHREHRLRRRLRDSGEHQRRRHRDGHHRRRGHRHGLTGIVTSAVNGTTTVNVGHNVTAGGTGIRSIGNGSGLIDINHTAGTITAGTIGINAAQTGSGTIDISQTGGALNGTIQCRIRRDDGRRQCDRLAHRRHGRQCQRQRRRNCRPPRAPPRSRSGVAFTSTGANAINATATSGNIAITNSSTVTGATNAVFGSTSGAFNITNSGTLNGNVNVTGSNAASTFANSGTWNAGTAGSTFSGSLNNTGTVNVQNGAAGQVITFAGNYSGDGAYRVDVDAAGNADRINVGGTANLTGGSVNALFLPGAYVSRNYTILSATGGLGGTTFTGGLTTTNLPAGFAASLSYTADRRAARISRAIARHRRQSQPEPAERRQHAQQFLQQWRRAAAGLRRRCSA